ncbi:hypothetical protein [Seonamhaeicola sp. ML3]|uniref:hypothetical protein n=1 Tax=Seonamhaeicola sp. ML3 TaxID=2937786 RepID=UPI00200FB0D2|nr:hypothetical protein [Seonamhaeicola sp. ML3]
MNGTGNDYPTKMFGISILISIPIIYFQYPILNFRKNWIYKSLIFYLSMVIFLFIFGIVMAWNEKVGNNEAGTWLARFDSGLRMNIYGQIFGGFFAFIIISLMNFGFKNQLFEK